MAETDWTTFNDGLDIAALDRGVTTGATPPSGGGSFVFGFNSLSAVVGAAALFTNQANFAPTPALRGGSVRGAVKRGVSGGTTGFSPFLLIGAQGPSVNDYAYMLGLMDDDPHHIALAKGRIVNGIPSGSPGNGIILARSSATYLPDTYHHLRLDMVVNQNGDVLLQSFRSDLGAHAVTAPAWVAIPGMAQFIDDALAVNSGTQPLTSGRMGFGMAVKDVARRGYFDHIECFRQL
jgi:hypothetical protein